MPYGCHYRKRIKKNTCAKLNIKIKVMSDTVKKYFEMVEDGVIFESPDKGKTIYKRPFGANPLDRELVKKSPEVNEDQWLETFANIARHYPDAKLDILRALTKDELAVKKVCD